MPRRRPQDPDASRHGSMAEGQVQQTIQMPQQFRQIFRAEAMARGHSSVKHLGTLATGLLLGMPPAARHALYVWISTMRPGELRDLQPEDVYKAFARLMHIEGETPDNERVAWLVTRILSPEISLPPEERPGRKNEEKRGAG